MSPPETRPDRIASAIGASLLMGIALGFLVGRMTSTPRATEAQRDLGAVFDAHLTHEFIDQDVEATLRTMTAEPYVHHVPTLTGGFGQSGLRRFYTDEVAGKMPADAKRVRISRTVGDDQMVIEAILSFTHDVAIDFMLPGVPPTGRYVEVPYVMVIKFQGDKIAHEHIYWDQASLLAQIGLLGPKHLPVVGVEQATTLRKLAENRKPSAEH